MIVIRLAGGLGNQMFQVAFAKTIGKINNVEVGFDLTFLEKEIKGITKRNFELDIFGIRKEQAKLKYTGKYLFDKSTISSVERIRMMFSSTPINYVSYSENIFKEELLQTAAPAYFVGYFQSESYFISQREMIQNLFEMEQNPSVYFESLIEKCRKNTSVSVHVRRKDVTTRQTTSILLC